MTEVEQLRKERDELRTQLEAWHSEFGTTQLTHARAKLDAALKVCAEMRNTLVGLFNHFYRSDDFWSGRIRHALSTDCGKGYVKAEAAEKACAELREAIESLWAHCDVSAFGGGKPKWLLHALSNECGKEK